MKQLFSFLFFSIAFCLSAQNKATLLLDKSVQTLKGSQGVEATFLLKENLANGKTTASFTGTIAHKGNKFLLDTPDTKTWFDGKTQWSLLKKNQEVNVSNPSAQELEMLNPIGLLELYKKGGKTIFKGERKIQGQIIHEIELIPTNAKSPWSKIYLRLNKTTSLPASILIRQKNGQTTEIIFEKIKTHLNLSDSIFVFNKNAYPRVDVIDLR